MHRPIDDAHGTGGDVFPIVTFDRPDGLHRALRRRTIARRVNAVLLGLCVVLLWAPGPVARAAEGDPSTPTAPAVQPPPTPATGKSVTPAPAKPAPPVDHRTVLRGSIGTRGPDNDRVGIGVAAEMRSPLPWGLEGGPGLELDLWQSQRDTSFISFCPIYWAIEYRPVRRLPNTFLSGRIGFDLLGQEGDDTLAAKSYYAVGIGLITHRNRPKNIQWELLYSRLRGAFPGVALSVGYRF